MPTSSPAVDVTPRQVRSRRSAAPLLLAAAALLAAHGAVSAERQPAARREPAEWPAYGGNPAQTRYSPLASIRRSNVQRLRVAWTYDTGESGGLQTNPIVVDGTLYANTPTHKVIALDAATGALRWRFDSKLESKGANRGVAYWADGEDRRIFAAVQHYVYALDARTGTPMPVFGDQGRIDLHRNLDRNPAEQDVRLTTPGIVYRDLLIVGGRNGESLPTSPGYIRAYDARHGTLRWSFHTIPHPAEFGHETWSPQSWKVNGAANNWAGMALDERRGIVYVPTGSAAADFYGANRVGDNLFANSLLALDAATGKRLWHFQAVRHDLWDRDFPSPPTLVTIRHAGRAVDAVVQTSKQGFVFVFDRVTGRPLFPIEYRKAPASDVPGEVAADTQPVVTRPRPLSRQRLTRDLLTRRTPEAHRWAVAAFERFRVGDLFLPLAVGADTVVFPGFDGGAEWGGSAFDPATGLLYVNANDLAWTGGLALNDGSSGGRAIYLRECASCHREDLAGDPPRMPSLVGLGARTTSSALTKLIREGAGRMPGYPNLSAAAVDALTRFLTTGRDTVPPADPASPSYIRYRFTGYRRFLDPDGYPATAPPWGTLNAIDLNTGEYAWTVPLGEYPELAARGVKDTGSENYGGPVVTAGGLVFIGATSFDRKLRAFDARTGALLWETTLPFSGNATPAIYEAAGRQFLVIAAGGGKSAAPSGGVYVAFALPGAARVRDNRAALAVELTPSELDGAFPPPAAKVPLDMK